MTDFNPIELLVSIGLVTIIIEMFFMPGLGFLFFGMGAFTTAGILYYFPSVTDYQYIVVAIVSCIWFILLWKPLKHYMHKRKGPEAVLDIIGSSVEIMGSDLAPGAIGKVKWSGTIMNAKLADNVDGQVPVGSVLKVSRIEGNVLVLAPLKAL